MNTGWAENIIYWAAGILAYGTLAILLYGIFQGTRREAGRVSGKPRAWLRSAWFYAAATALFVGLCILGWNRIPAAISTGLKAWMLIAGALLLFPGMGLVLWGRLTLGSNYFVSTAGGAQLFEGHGLVTNGPYAYLRHPMYSGLVLAALGSLLVYFTWTSLAFAVFAPFVVIRARHEDAVLEAEFGEEWRNYRKRVGGFFPRMRKQG